MERPTLNINWGVDAPKLSEKINRPSEEFDSPFTYENNYLGLVLATVLIALAFTFGASISDDVHPVEARPSTVKPFELPKKMSIVGEVYL